MLRPTEPTHPGFHLLLNTPPHYYIGYGCSHNGIPLPAYPSEAATTSNSYVFPYHIYNLRWSAFQATGRDLNQLRNYSAPFLPSHELNFVSNLWGAGGARSSLVGRADGADLGWSYPGWMKRWVEGAGLWKESFQPEMSALGSASPSAFSAVGGTVSTNVTPPEPRFDFSRLAESATRESDVKVGIASHGEDTAASTPRHLLSSSGYSSVIGGDRESASHPVPSDSLPCEQEPGNTKGSKRQKRDFVCQFCQRPFTKSYNLLIHERTHTDERPFHCDLCGKNFRRKDHLRDHRYTHFPQKPFTCTLCGKGFCQQRTLTVHKATHPDNRS
ncbi:uncharacterized protein LOC143276871 [Babylonia areolata]|uniref:uncharacterized protein LOC143276871 n=1 Tax=Babylonia areolata TaxID=304850 RepID=UPI003FD31287